jgi:D-3-phosphoglycerate dehydrogenase
MWDQFQLGRVLLDRLSDVFEQEPLKESPFYEMNNVIMTPHLGASTKEAQTNVSVEIVEQFIEFFKQ